jgi:hypothetical protein
VPKEWQCDRYGARAYHNLELMTEISENQPEFQLLNVINEALPDQANVGEDWRGSAQELWKTLRESKFAFIVERLIYNPSVLGAYLGRLARQYPERFSQTRCQGTGLWLIRALDAGATRRE